MFASAFTDSICDKNRISLLIAFAARLAALFVIRFTKSTQCE